MRKGARAVSRAGTSERRRRQLSTESSLAVSLLLLVVGGPLGRSKRLNHLNGLIAKYSNFTHAEEMEAMSRVYRYTFISLQLGLLTLFLAMPVAAIILVGFSEAIGMDVVHHLRPDMPLPHNVRMPSEWTARVYGVVLGIPAGVGLIYLGEAKEAASSLSGIREKMLKRWQEAKFKLEGKLGVTATQENKSLSARA